MSIEQNIQQFRMDLLRKMPFYGDVAANLDFLPRKDIPTACTDGLSVYYNPTFMERRPVGEQNFILMHELLHILLMHPSRGVKKDHHIANIAADYIVNDILIRITSNFGICRIPFSVPSDACTGSVNSGESFDNVYERLRARQPSLSSSAANDLFILPLAASYKDLSDEEREAIVSAHVSSIVRSSYRSYEKEQMLSNSVLIPDEIMNLVCGKQLNWKSILKDLMSEYTSDETSYATPERKYLHMDIILPGHGPSEEVLECVWAFVDSSGSISHGEMNEFLTQLYLIVRDFKCELNIVYWDTSVTDVYMKIQTKEDVLKSTPHHSGGTNINCVYQWIKDNHIRPEVMLILTDGYFGVLNDKLQKPSLAKRTVLVLNNQSQNSTYSKIGKIARL